MQKAINYIVVFLCVAAITVLATSSSSNEFAAESYTFKLTANITKSLGDITITQSDSTTSTLSVPSTGVYTQSVNNTVTSITIGGVTVSASNNTVIIRTDGNITITWVSPLIVIVDQNEF